MYRQQFRGYSVKLIISFSDDEKRFLNDSFADRHQNTKGSNPDRYFLNSLTARFFTKVAKVLGDFQGNFEKHRF